MRRTLGALSPPAAGGSLEPKRDGGGAPSHSGNVAPATNSRGVGALYLLLALLYTYPLVLDVRRANRFDSPDALLCAWTLAWDLHELGRAPWDLFDANIFYPEKNALAYSENLLAAALLVAPLRIFTENPIFLLNAALLMALAASGLATYVLARELGASSLAAFLGGALFAFAPFRWAHVPHLQLQLAFPIPLAFYFVLRIARGASARAAAGLALTIPLAFASSGYYALYLLTALLPMGFFVRRKAFLLALAVGVALALPLVLPYLGKLSEGSRRTLEEVSRFSAGPREYASSFSRAHFFLPKAAEPLFPGFTALALSLASLARSSRKEKWLLLGLAALGVALSTYAAFSLLFRVVPAYQGLRVPSRAGILFLLAVALLASMGLDFLRSRGLRLGIALLAGVECYAGPLPWSFETPRISPIYAHVRAPLVEIPLPHPDQFQLNAGAVYRSTAHFMPLVNGYSGFVPESYREIHRRLTSDFDDGLRHLRSLGVKLLLAHEGRLGPRIKREIDEGEAGGRLRLVAEEEGAKLYEIRE